MISGDSYIPYVVLTHVPDSGKWSRKVDIDCHTFPIHIDCEKK
jgi:hypothetical protein